MKYVLKNNWLFLLVYVFLSLFTQCDTNVEPNEQVLGFLYFPIEIGNFIEYEVEEIQFDLVNGALRSTYQLREEITESFTDIDGDIAFRQERFRRDNPSEPWVPVPNAAVWVIERNNFQAFRTEDNQPFVKLTFPLDEGNTWDGNAFNGMSQEEYQIVDFGLNFEIDSINYSPTLRVIQNDACNLVEQDRRVEVYAEGIGLIYREIWDVRFESDPGSSCLDTTQQYCEAIILQPTPPKPNFDCVEFGNIFTQKIINYGKTEL